MNISISEILKIVVTAVLTSSLTYIFTFKKDKDEKIFRANKELLDEVFKPIIKILNNSVFPGDCYEGLSIGEIQKIIDILENNLPIIEPKLESYILDFKEEIMINSYENSSMHDIYDFDGKFKNYIDYEYNKIRRKLYLPYSRSPFLYYRIYNYFLLMYLKIKRIIKRKFKK